MVETRNKKVVVIILNCNDIDTLTKAEQDLTFSNDGIEYEIHYTC